MPLRLSKHRVLLDGIPLNESKASDLPSASTPDIWSVTGNTVPLSGTATITGFTPAPQAGAKRTLLCTGTPSFTHSTNLLLPGSANYTATAGDRIEVLAITTTQFRLAVTQSSVLPDVQFAKDGSGNVTGLKNPGGGVHATLGTNVLTVGAGGKYATIQAAITYISSLPQFVEIFSGDAGFDPGFGSAVTAWTSKTSIVTKSGGIGTPNMRSDKRIFFSVGTEPILYPFFGGSAVSIRSGMRRCGATISVSTPLHWYTENMYTVLLLDRVVQESVNLTVPVNVEFTSINECDLALQLKTVAAVTHGRLKFSGGIHISRGDDASYQTFSNQNGGGWDEITYPTGNAVIIELEHITIRASAADMFSPMAIVGSFSCNNCKAYTQSSVAWTHFFNFMASGDISVTNFDVFATVSTGLSPDLRIFDYSQARNFEVSNLTIHINDLYGSLLYVGVVSRLQDYAIGYFQGLATNYSLSGITILSPKALHATFTAVIADEYGGGGGLTAVPMGTIVHISNVTFSPFVELSGYSRLYRADAAGTPSNTTVVVNNCGGLRSDVSALGTLKNKGPGGAISVSYSATVIPDANIAEVHNIGTLTGNITIAAPTNPQTGQRLTLNYTQNATGSWTITYNAVFKAAAPAVGGANQKGSHSFVYDGTNWVQTGGPLVWL